MPSLIDKQREIARRLQKTICLPEAKDDARTMKAARMFLDEKLGIPMLVGTPDEIRNSTDPVIQQFITGSAHGPITDRHQQTEHL